MSRATVRCILIGLMLGLAGCARHYSSDAVSDPYGFFSGVWHGLILTISVVVNVISWLLNQVGISFLESIEIVGRPNTGFGYWAGFVLGICAVGSSAR